MRERPDFPFPVVRLCDTKVGRRSTRDDGIQDPFSDSSLNELSRVLPGSLTKDRRNGSNVPRLEGPHSVVGVTKQLLSMKPTCWD